MVKAIIFDADHTLYTPDTEKAYEEQFGFLSDNLGVDQDRLEEIWREEVSSVIGSSDPEERKRHVALERALTEVEFSVKDREGLAKEAVKHFWDQIVKDLEYDPEIVGLVEQLQEKVETLAVASDEFRQPLERKLNRVFGDWKDYFDFLITPEKTGSMKPSREFYNRTLDKAGIAPSEVVMVGDSWRRDLKPAEEAGLTTVLLSDQKEGKPDFHIRRIKEIEGIIEELE